MQQVSAPEENTAIVVPDLAKCLELHELARPLLPEHATLHGNSELDRVIRSGEC